MLVNHWQAITSVKHKPNPDVTLDRTLTFKARLANDRRQLQTRNKLLRKHARTSWGAQAQTLRQAELALCYSSAEYCAPVRERSNHTHVVDAQQCAPSQERFDPPTQRDLKWLRKHFWLPVLCNTALAHIRRARQSAALLGKLREAEDLPVFEDVFNPTQLLLGYRI